MTTRSRVAAAQAGVMAGVGIVLLAVLLVARVGAFPTADGISYLDLSDAALEGRWHEFVSAYWSPLFPACIGAVRSLVGTAPGRESLATGLVNIAAVASSAAFFASLLRSLSLRGILRGDGTVVRAAHVVCWSAFAGVVLRISPATLSTPDLLVFAAQLAALAALMRAGADARSGRFAFALGIALGAAFLAKGALLVLSGTYLVALALLVPRARLVRAMTLAVAGFAIVATPWIAILSLREGELTAGSVARLNLAWYVGGQSSQVPDPDAAGIDSLPHRWPRVHDVPAVYDFAPHLVGTYPPWTDPTWSNAGLVPRPSLRRLRAVLLDGASTIWSLFGAPLLLWFVLAAGAGFRLHVADRRLTLAFALLALSQVGVYLPVHVEIRFLGVAWLCSWLAVITVACSPAAPFRIVPLIVAALAAATVYSLHPPALGTYTELAVAAVAAAIIVIAYVRSSRRSMILLTAMTAVASAPWCASVLKGIKTGVGPLHRRDLAIAQVLRRAGVADGAAVASVNATAPASWARLGRWHVAIEVAQSSAALFWRLDETQRELVLRDLMPGRVGAVIGIRDEGDPAPAGWLVVPGTGAVILPAAPMPR